MEQVGDNSSSVTTVAGEEYDLNAMVRKSDNASIRRVEHGEVCKRKNPEDN